MYAVELFYNNICKLSKSLVIKFDLVIKAMEFSTNFLLTPSSDGRVGLDFETEHFTVPDKMIHLRFYRHIAGELYKGIEYSPNFKTSPDTDVMVKVIENETLLPLSKDLLEKYPLTKSELLKFGDYYEGLVRQYPTMILYIHGCLYPVDVRSLLFTKDNKLKEVKDGTILSYNPIFVEEQEWSLIKDLEDFIKQYKNRWFIKEYIVSDNLYLQSFLAGLFSQIPGKIFTLRTNKIGTNQAHSFFLEAFFRSNMDLWDAFTKLNKESIWWLYRNLSGIIKNIGKNDTLEKLLVKVFDRNSVGVGGYYVTRGDAILTTDQYINNLKAFEPGKTIIKAEPLNANYNITGNGQIPLKSLLEKELDLTKKYTPEQEEYIIQTSEERLRNGAANRANTKVLEVSTLKEYTGFNVDKLKVIIDYWAYLLYMSYYGSFSNSDITTSKVEFSDPNTGNKYSINSKIGFFMVLKVMLHATNNVSTPIRKYTITRVLDPNINPNKILTDYLYPDGLTILLKPELVESYPVLNKTLSSIGEVSEHLNLVLDYFKNLWITSGNAESIFVSANIRNFLYLTSFQEEINLHSSELDMTVDDILSENGITNFNIYGDYDHMATIKDLILNCLGVEINSYERLANLLLAYKEIITKLTSYTLQPLGVVNEGSSNYIYNTRNNLIKMKKGIIKLDETKIKGTACNKDHHLVTFIPYLPNEEIRRYDITPTGKQDFMDFNTPVGSALFFKDGITWDEYRNDKSGCMVELITLPAIPSYETIFKRQYIDWIGTPNIIGYDKNEHNVYFQGEREQVKTSGSLDQQPSSRFKKTDKSEGVYEEHKNNTPTGDQAIVTMIEELEE